MRARRSRMGQHLSSTLEHIQQAVTARPAEWGGADEQSNMPPVRAGDQGRVDSGFVNSGFRYGPESLIMPLSDRKEASGEGCRFGARSCIGSSTRTPAFAPVPSPAGFTAPALPTISDAAPSGSRGCGWVAVLRWNDRRGLVGGYLRHF